MNPTDPQAPTLTATVQRFDEPAGVFALWFGVLGPPVIWMVRLVGSYVLVPYACWSGWILLLHGLTALTLAGTALAGCVAWRSWRLTGSGEETGGSGLLHRSRFLALFGILSAAFFFFVIAAEGLTNFFVDPCLTGGERVHRG